MRKVIICLLTFTLMLAGCSKSSGSGASAEMTSLSIPITSGMLFTMHLPKTEVIETDNNEYWKFADGTELYSILPSTHFSERYDEELDIYTSASILSRDIEDIATIMFKGKKKNLDKYKNALIGGEVSDVIVNLEEYNELKSLPDYEDKSEEMEMTTDGLYMPLGSTVTQGVYRADIVCEGVDYIESFILDKKYDDVVPQLVTIANCNTEDNGSYYTSDKVFYYTNGDRHIIAKQLTLNQWCVYNCTGKYLDYALTGANTVVKKH